LGKIKSFISQGEKRYVDQLLKIIMNEVAIYYAIPVEENF
jgi:hypothetical protein